MYFNLIRSYSFTLNSCDGRIKYRYIFVINSKSFVRMLFLSWGICFFKTKLKTFFVLCYPKTPLREIKECIRWKFKKGLICCCTLCTVRETVSLPCFFCNFVILCFIVKIQFTKLFRLDYWTIWCCGNTNQQRHCHVSLATYVYRTDLTSCSIMCVSGAHE